MGLWKNLFRAKNRCANCSEPMLPRSYIDSHVPSLDEQFAAAYKCTNCRRVICRRCVGMGRCTCGSARWEMCDF
jgi:uncharacterized protein with PIN domain